MQIALRDSNKAQSEINIDASLLSCWIRLVFEIIAKFNELNGVPLMQTLNVV
jgi:hypothetical protein